jgi:small subunit ribosomal protein S6
MYRYETLFILHPELPEAQVRETQERVRRLIEGMGGAVVEIQDWGQRELAYLIRKQPRGIYVLAMYSARPEVVKELERTLKLADDVLRYVSVRLPKGWKPPVPTVRPTTAPSDEQPESAATEQGS